MFLYTDAKGYPVQAHSYSGGEEFSDCNKKYDYARRQGWKQRERKASSEFGRALEDTIQYFHAKDCYLPDAIDEWKRLWALRQDDKGLVYSEKDGDWHTMYRQGAEMITLYARRLPTLPIKNPKFQVNYKKELYPDTEYAGLQFTSFVDMETVIEWNHSALPTTVRPENGQRTVIIDIKTSGSLYSIDPRMVSLDPQLRTYSWATGHETVAFLVFVKRNPDIEKGDTVTLVDAWSKEHQIGEELVVLKVDGEVLVLLAPAIYEKYEQEAKGLKGNALKAKVEDFAKDGYHVRADEVTKQRLQFLAATISEEERNETGEVIGQQAIAISQANANNFFPKKPGIRFPNNHCLYCSYLGLCINDQKMVEEKLINIALPKETRKDWLDEI